MRNMADVHIDLTELEDMFDGSDHVVDAEMRVNDIRKALMRQGGERTADDARSYVPNSSRLPETTKALAIVARIERAAHVKNTAAGRAACRQLRSFAEEHGWVGFN
jgi:hypothetical protein